MKQKNASKLWKRALSTGLSLAMAVTLLPAAELKAEPAASGTNQLLKARSTDGVEGETFTRNQPFIPDVTGATEDGDGRPFFKAPSLVVKETLSDSTHEDNCTVKTASGTVLIAAAEGRFDQDKKAGGTDVIAAVSKDQGATWTYSYPLRFPDSEGNAGVHATSINNPVLTVAADGTIYCLMNVTPTGVSSLAGEGDGFKYPAEGTGYKEIGDTKRLMLTENAATADNPVDTYTYYVGDWDGDTGLAKVLQASDNSESDYAVDKWYNLYKKDADSETYAAITQKRADENGDTAGSGDVQQNVFYAGSELHVYNTSYIVCVTSANGLSWSAPEILNPYVKKDDGKSLVVAGGKGLTTSKNRLVFPVYRNNDGTNEDGSSSIIWLDKSTGGDNQWHRSNNVPQFADAEDTDSSWIGEGEVVELSDGKLRMVFRNSKGLISYADAQRNAQNEFEFSAPVTTGTRSPENAHPSVISYLNPIEERKGLLIAAPVGENRTNGRIMTFLATDSGVEGDGEEETATGGMTRVEGIDVPGGSSYFQNPCIEQFDAGNKIGLVWENGNGRVRFNKFGILDVVKEHYIPHITVDLDMIIGEKYERTYTVVGKSHMNGVTQKPMNGEDEDTSVIAVEFKAGQAVTEQAPALYPHAANNGEHANLSSAFLSTDEAIAAAVDQTIERAEFTIMRPNNSKPDEYEVYSSLEKRYYLGPTGGSNDNKNTEFSAVPGTVTITKTPENYKDGGIADNLKINEDEFSIILKNANGKMARMAGFYGPKLRFDKQDNWTDNKTSLDPGFTLLQKMKPDETLSGDQAGKELIKGYKKVTEITPNEKYLIAYVPKSGDGNLAVTNGDSFTQEGVQPIFILYPRNNVVTASSNTKLVYGTREVERRAEKNLKITANGEGTATVVANEVTYNVTVHDLDLQMPKGTKKFFPGAEIGECSSNDEKVATVEEHLLETPSLFDCLRTADNSLDGYSTEANTDIDMSAAEFTFTAAEGTESELYTIQSVVNEQYLVNRDGKEYFGRDPITHKVSRSVPPAVTPAVTPVTPQAAETFEIRRVSNDDKNNRYVYFFYGRMAFDAVAMKVDNGRDFTKEGKFDFELLEKQEYPTDLDQISGYRRVGKITSGKTYLITQTYQDSKKGQVRFVLYPENSITLQSKMYHDVETAGVQIRAVGNVGDKTTVTIGGRTYNVTITAACDHVGYGRYRKGAKEATCTVDGHEGDLYCENCDEKVEDGAIIPAGHDVPEGSWQITTQPSFEKDGEYTGTCIRCGETLKKPYTKEEYADKQLGDIVKAARALTETDYTVKSYAPLKTALGKVDSVEDTAAAKKVLYDEITAAMEGLELQADFDATKNKLKTKLVSMKEALGKKEEDFDPNVWTALNNAANDLKAAAIGIDLSQLADAAAIEAKLDTLALTVLNDAWDIVKDVSTSTIEEALEEAERAKLKTDIKNAVNDVKPIIQGGQKNYTDDSWKNLTTAYNAANVSDAILDGKTKEELQTILDNLQAAKDGLEEKESEEVVAAKEAVAQAVKAADGIVAAGQKNYTKATWDAFLAAYNAAKNPPANADAATLKRLADDLIKAQNALKTAPPVVVNPLVKGMTEDVNQIRYQVLDANQKTVTAQLGLNKKAKSIMIPATVKIKGVDCTVTEISGNAFKGYGSAKKLTIGANVTTIGKKAFLSCKKLKTVTLQSKILKSVKGGAFKGTAKSAKVKWPKGLKSAQKKKLTRAFKKSGLKIK